MKSMRRLPSIPARLVFWGLAAASLVVSHDAVWTLQVGAGKALADAMRHAGHDYWGPASAGVGAVVALVAFVTLRRLIRLARRADELNASRPSVARPPFLRRAATNWLRLAMVVAIGFVVQENLEHALSHGHVPWIGALVGPEYPLALPVIAAITLVAAVVGTVVITAEQLLIATIEAARLGLRAPRRLRRHPSGVVVRAGVALSRANAGRAPPSLPVYL
jgi:hypothetical protein